MRRAKPGHTCLPAPQNAPVTNLGPLRRSRTVRQSAHFRQHLDHCTYRTNIAKKSAQTANTGTNDQCGAQNQVTPAYQAWDNALEPSEPRSFGPAYETAARFESIQQERRHKAKGGGRTFLGGGAAARGTRPLITAVSRRPIGSPKLGVQALAAEPHEVEHEAASRTCERRWRRAAGRAGGAVRDAAAKI